MSGSLFASRIHVLVVTDVAARAIYSRGPLLRPKSDTSRGNDCRFATSEFRYGTRH